MNPAKIGLNYPSHRIIVVWLEGRKDFPGYCSTSPPPRTWPEWEAGRAIQDLPRAVFLWGFHAELSVFGTELRDLLQAD